MRILFLWVLLSFFVAAATLNLTPQQQAWIETHKKISFAGDPNWLPFEALNEKSEYIGIVAEHLKLVESLTGLEFVLKPTQNWLETLNLARQKKVKVVSSDRADEILNKKFRPITPYLINPVVIIMDKDNHYVDDLNKLKDKRIAVIRGYGYTGDIFKVYRGLHFVEVANIQEGLKKVHKGELDAMLATMVLARYHISKLGYENLKVVGKSSVVMELTLFVDKQEPMLHAILDKAISKISIEHSQHIISKWIHEPNDDLSLSWIVWIIIVTLAVLLSINIFKNQKLKESKEFYSFALAGANDALWHWDIQREIVFYSSRMQEILGFEDKEFSNTIDDWIDLIHPEDQQRAKDLMQLNLEAITNEYKIEYRMASKGGHWKWIRVRAKTAFDDTGNALRMDGICTDITQEKETMIRNQQKTKSLESAQEIGHLGSWEWDMASGDLTWSDEVYRIFGERPQSFPATYDAFKSYIPQEYIDGLEQAIEQAITHKTPYEYDHEIIRRDGLKRLVREAGYVLFDIEGNPKAMFGTVLDIDSVVEVKTTKRENEELNELLKKFDENVIASNTDTRGIITYASKAFSQISGYSHAELIGAPQNIVRHPDTPTELFKDLWETITSGKTWQGEIKNRRKDGTHYWVYNTISPVFDKKGIITGYSAIRHDLTHEKEAELLHKHLELKSQELMMLNRELEQRINQAVAESKSKDHLMAQQSKLASMGEMIGNIAHQWRQPLNALGLLLQKQQIFFDKGVLTSEKMKENVQKGSDLIQKMSTTIDDFRDFFKPNKEKSNFDVKEAVEDTVALVNAALYNQNISFSTDMQEGLIVYGYKNEFSQVILNLVNNAKDALVEQKRQDGEILIRSYIEGDYIHVDVSDNAGGISDKIIESIFEPYFTTKDEGKGTGIGLYMSKMIIEENMGGFLRVENSGKGAVFTVALKLDSE